VDGRVVLCLVTLGGSSTIHIYTQTLGGSSTVHIHTQTPGGSSTVHIYTQHSVAAVQYTFTHKHPVAAVQYTFTQKQNTDYRELNIHNNKKKNLGSAGLAPSLRVIPWHLPYN
jgi:opacity protein-like surface antigen